jgi:hypothetical protein
LIEALEQRGVHVHPSPLDGPADQAAIEFVESTHVWLQGLIYYGDVDRDWFEAVFSSSTEENPAAPFAERNLCRAAAHRT